MKPKLMSQQPKYIVLGRIGAPYGIAGYNHIQSYSNPVEDILTYQQWKIRKNENSELRCTTLEKGRVHAQGIVAKLEGISDRDAAQLLTGCEIVIDRNQLPALPEGEYYWNDLEGLTVETTLGVVLGQVSYLYSNAGHTNMVVNSATQERHIPFIEPDFVTNIDVEAKKITVDWDPEL